MTWLLSHLPAWPWSAVAFVAVCAACLLAVALLLELRDG